ncbi:dethiobiotin synthase [Suttonella sp. R2A3]|uniref:dethiobiotin synthase n=1 Tax=Suttonella sp. R2A3 TaxID=2908648 RepID=UPI001F482DFE|nr:dethiobiotin synthase [Suttonella sp. R2A3]UJF24908.1 dethiobiotin synthase [Suttonella sp. R2A3]
MKIFFITGIGTDIGKTYVTARLLRALMAYQIKVSSFKLVQTGMTEGQIAPDILAHRSDSGQPLSEADRIGLSCGATFPYAASPHLAASLLGTTIDGAQLWQRLTHYATTCGADVVFCEGAGGVFVPLNHTELTVDWLIAHRLPIILIANAALGSIHHSIATLEAMRSRGISPRWLIYNPYPYAAPLIAQDSSQYLAAYLARNHPTVGFLHLSAGSKLPEDFINIFRD